MQEPIIGFEVAKLAKNKGFKELCLNYYFEDGELRENMLNTTNGYYGEEVTFEYEDLIENWNDGFLTKKDGSRCFGCSKSNGYLETYSAPTQALLQKWLREVHEVHVEIIVNYEQRNQTRSYRVGIIHITQLSSRRFLQTTFIRPENDKNEFIEFSTYEEALEDGLFEALKLIK